LVFLYASCAISVLRWVQSHRSEPTFISPPESDSLRSGLKF